MKFAHVDPYWFTEEGIRKIEKDYKAKYMGYWCTRHSGGWWNEVPVDVFYQETPDHEKGHTHYFGMFWRDKKVFITNAESAFSVPITGILVGDEIIVSRYRHNCVIKGEYMVDGGRDYLRTSGNSPTFVTITVNGGEFIFNTDSKSFDKAV